jgi:hypothetical protein
VRPDEIAVAQLLRSTLVNFDVYLAGIGLVLDAVVVGRAALALLGVTGRQTRGCDVLDPDLRCRSWDAARAFAAERRRLGEALDDDWLNNGTRRPAPDTTGRLA